MKSFVYLSALSLFISACSTLPNDKTSSDAAIPAQFSRYAELSKQLPPSSWHEGARWQFHVPGDRRTPENRLTFKITQDLANTCVSGDWKKLVVVHETVKATSSPAYLLEGRNLLILLSTDLCDAYDEIKGELSDAGFLGDHVVSGMLGGTTLGQVTGTPLTP